MQYIIVQQPYRFFVLHFNFAFWNKNMKNLRKVINDEKTLVFHEKSDIEEIWKFVREKFKNVSC